MEQHPNAKLTPKGARDARLAHRIRPRRRRGRPPDGNQPPDRQQMAAQEQVRRGALRPKQPPAKAGEAHAARSRGAGLRGPLLDAARPARLAATTACRARTCARIVSRRGMPRLADVDRVTGEARRRGPVTPVRYERERPGELLHVDVKKVARIPDGGGHRALGRGCAPRGARARPACTSARRPTSAGSPTPSCCPTSARHLRGVHGPVPALLRGAWACGSSA